MTHAHADAETIRELLRGKVDIETSVIESAGSTNALCRELDGTTHPQLIVAREQTAGRGRFDRRFDSVKDAGLYMSISFEPKGISSPAVITAAAGVAVCFAIENQTSVLPKLKWVNDVYFGELKLAGILAEGVIGEDGKIARAIVGIGVNVKSRVFPTELCGIATSIEDAMGVKADINRLCADITERFFTLVGDKARTMELYRRLSCVIGKSITVHTSDSVCEALAKDIDGDGNLVIETKDGQTKLICSGEISIRFNHAVK